MIKTGLCHKIHTNTNQAIVCVCVCVCVCVYVCMSKQVRCKRVVAEAGNQYDEQVKSLMIHKLVVQAKALFCMLYVVDSGFQ